MKYKLLHFTDKDSLDLKMKYSQNFTKDFKPRGLWVSNENDFGWMHWVEAEKFKDVPYKYCFEVILNSKNNVLFLETKNQFLAFQEKHRVENMSTFNMDWNSIVKHHQGLVIPKYFWDFRLAEGSMWYYGWDCASGCIWDLKAVEKFEKTAYPVKSELK